jgi:8-amino-7-oxononanoate synthase
MPDFTSALYLGLRHGTACLPPWQALTEGRPAVLGEVAGATEVARRLARLAGVPRALLYPSTLHLFLDLLETLGRRPIALLWDAGLYPVPRWAIERAVGQGVPARAFDQHRPDTLERALERSPAGRAPVIVTTGFCPGCGELAPLPALLRRAKAAGGYLIIDDTQMFGLLGRGGGGSARFLDLPPERCLIGVSLAKAFGAPVAFLGGASSVVANVARHGSTRWHASPVSAVAVAAAAHAMDVNADHGDALRARLLSLSSRLARGLGPLGAVPDAPALPMQSTVAFPRAIAEALHAAVERRGVRCLLQRARCRDGARLTFLVTAEHDEGEIDAAISAVKHGWKAIGPETEPAVHFRCVDEGRM